MAVVSQCCGKDVDGSSLLHFQLLTQLLGAQGEVAHRDVGLIDRR